MIYIIRHGQTELNKAHALQGRSDLPLNENGVREAEEARKWFEDNGIEISYIFSSPLERAMKTAEIAAPGAEMNTDDRLLEMDYGPYEGMDLRDPAPEVTEFFRDFVNNPAPEGMEQLSDVVKRTGGFIEEIRSLEGNILVSTHAIAMKGILEYLTPDSKGSYWSKHIGNCTVYAYDNSGKDGGDNIPTEVKK